jgi:uncharacterized membrane protein
MNKLPRPKQVTAMEQHERCIVVIKRLADAVPLGAGAAVMASGVVSSCFLTTGAHWPSWLLFGMAAMVWLALVATFVTRLLADRSRWLSEAGLPSALTLVAGTAVLGTWLSAAGPRLGWDGPLLRPTSRLPPQR